MFEELGFKISTGWDCWTVFRGEGGGFVQFIPSSKLVRVPLTDYDLSEHSHLLYVAINEKMKELGWIE